MDVTDHHKIDKLHTLYCTTTDARLARRIQVVWLARRGLTCPQIMQAVGASRRAVQQWVAKYNLLDSVTAGVNLFCTEPISGDEQDETQFLVLGDLIWKF